MIYAHIQYYSHDHLWKNVIKISVLLSAIHPQHGLVWANGKTINLEKVSILNDQVENNIPLKLGEFE